MAIRRPSSLAASEKAGFNPTDEPQKTQIFKRSGDLELVVVLVLAHHFIGNDPRRDNGENE
jgi:hypothetical protein